MYLITFSNSKKKDLKEVTAKRAIAQGLAGIKKRLKPMEVIGIMDDLLSTGGVRLENKGTKEIAFISRI